MIKTCYSSNENEILALLSESKENPTLIVFEDDGFLLMGMTSPFRYYVDGRSFIQKEEKPLFANFISLPELWEITMDYTHGEIIDDGVKKGIIEFSLPIEEHNVKNISWLDIFGNIYKKDCYDKYGKLYFTELYGEDKNVNVRIYFSENKPVIIEQPKFDMYTLICNGKKEKIFCSKKEFCNYFMDEILPGEINDSSDEHFQEILILTNSDNLENISVLVENLSEFHFHIGAKTLMSEKLHNLKSYGNVSLYEGISELQRSTLLEHCSYYFDINHGTEICNSVYEAYRHGLLITGFSNTLHNEKYTLSDCVFLSQDVEKMIAMVKELKLNPDRFNGIIKTQIEKRKK